MGKIKKFARKDTIIEAVCWDKKHDSYTAIKSWTNDRVQLSGDILLLQTPDLVEHVKDGHYIVKVNDESYYVYTPDDLFNMYDFIN